MKTKSLTQAAAVGAAAVVLFAAGTAVAKSPKHDLPTGVSLDPKFGNKGVAVVPSDGSPSHGISSCLVGENNAVLASTYSGTYKMDRNGWPQFKRKKTGLVMYDSRGRVVKKFGSNGFLRRAPVANARIASKAIDAQGRLLLLLAWKGTKGHASSLRIARLTRSGKLDRSFATRGIKTYQEPSGKLTPHSLTLVDGGMLVSATSSVNDRELIKFDRSANLMPGFGKDGVMRYTSPAQFFTPAADGGIFLSGARTDPATKVSSVYVERRGRDGEVRTDWASGGRYEISSMPSSVGAALNPTDPTGSDTSEFDSHYASQVREISDGSIVFGVSSYADQPYEAALVWAQRLLPNGSLDTSYGTGGSALIADESPMSEPSSSDYESSWQALRADGSWARMFYSFIDKGFFSASVSSADGKSSSGFVKNDVDLGSDESHVVDATLNTAGDRVIACGLTEIGSRGKRAAGFIFSYKIP